MDEALARHVSTEEAALTKSIYDEEIAAGTSPKEAEIIALWALVSSEYRVAWMAGRAEQRKEEREIAEQKAEDAESYTGNPEEWEIR